MSLICILFALGGPFLMDGLYLDFILEVHLIEGLVLLRSVDIVMK